MSGRGGVRIGAGRKKGSLSIRTRQIAQDALANGLAPLDVMLGAMRQSWQQGDYLEAAAIARHAAPYVHPRISSNETTKEQWEEEHRQKEIELMDAAMKSAEAALRASRVRFEEMQSPTKESQILKPSDALLSARPA